MPERIHGHAVLEMLLAAPRPMTREALLQATEEEFGADARYYTCSADDMTIGELVQFLLARSKVSETNGCLTAHREEMCDHG
jgi:probable metal-binding protein